MKATYISQIALGCVLGVSSLTSCSENEDLNTLPPAGYARGILAATTYEQWSYFNFDQEKQVKTLDIEKIPGAATGRYEGTWTYTLGEINESEMAIEILPWNEDSVKIISTVALKMGGPANPVELTSYAVASQADNQWTLLAQEASSNLVDPDGDGTSTDYKIKVSGIIGTKPNDPVTLKVSLTPGQMPAAIEGEFASTVTNSFSYEVKGEDEFEWDFAMHLYEIRTNQGEVIALEASSLDQVTTIPNSGFKRDEKGYIMANLEGMMQNYVGYQYVDINPELYQWVTREETGTMPPVRYTLDKNKIFIIKTKEGKVVKLQFLDDTNDKGEDVYAKFQYGFMD